jgi:hypothetical protein
MLFDRPYPPAGGEGSKAAAKHALRTIRTSTLKPQSHKPNRLRVLLKIAFFNNNNQSGNGFSNTLIISINRF